MYTSDLQVELDQKVRSQKVKFWICITFFATISDDVNVFWLHTFPF